MKQRFLECGRITTTHGVRGGMRAESYCDAPSVLSSLSTIYMKDKNGAFLPFRVTDASVYKAGVILYLEGVCDMDAALLFRGRVLYADRKDLPLPEGSVFIADMLGLTVKDAETGRVYGEITDVTQAPASELWTVRTPAGETVLFPAVPAFVSHVNVDGEGERGAFIRPIEGFFD